MPNFEIVNLDTARWLDDIDRVMKSAYTVEAEILGVKSFPPLTREKADIQECGNLFVGYCNDDELCGVAEIEVSQPDLSMSEATIASLAVAPSHFRQGIARALVQAIVEMAYRPILVTTGTLNQPAIDLYLKLGFKETDQFTTPDGVAMVGFEFNR